jgi:hypothetical protein
MASGKLFRHAAGEVLDCLGKDIRRLVQRSCIGFPGVLAILDERLNLGVGSVLVREC